MTDDLPVPYKTCRCGFRVDAPIDPSDKDADIAFLRNHIHYAHTRLTVVLDQRNAVIEQLHYAYTLLKTVGASDIIIGVDVVRDFLDEVVVVSGDEP